MNSIRRRLTRELLAALALVLGAGLLAIGVTVTRRVTGSFDAALLAQARAVSALTELEGGRIQFDFSQEFLRGFQGLHAHHFFELWTDSGQIVTRSPALQGADLVVRRPNSEGHPRFYDLDLPAGRSGRAVSIAFRVEEAAAANKGRPRGQGISVVLVMAADRDPLNDTLQAMVAAVAGIGVLMIIAVLALVPRILARGLSPLDRLGADVGRIDAHTLSQRLDHGELPLELRPIAGRLNELLARLEASFERERRFSADLAHELRTPLAELRSLLECALKWPEARESATDQEALTITKELETLVGRMLALARGERGGLALKLEPVDLANLTADCWKPHETEAAARRLRVKFALEPGMVEADRGLTRSILTNLFENAVCYAPPETEVEIRGTAESSGYRIKVSNLAGDLTADDVEKLFDRFWRKEAARSGGRHLGLGLNLAATFARAMGWRLRAELTRDRKLVFVLEATQKSQQATPK